MGIPVFRLEHGFGSTLSADEAHASLLSLVDTVLRSGWEKWDSKPYSSYNPIFADLLYTVRWHSSTDAFGLERLHTILGEIIAEPFLDGIREALLLVKPEDVHALLTGIQPYMLRGKENPDLWEPMLKQNRTQLLMMDVDNAKLISEDIKEMIEYELGGSDSNNQILVDIPLDNGATGLIHALVFQPDLILSDLVMLGLRGAKMLNYIQKHHRTRNTPYSLITAHTAQECYTPLESEIRLNAKHFLAKAFTANELITVIASHIDFARAKASE